MTFPNIIEKNSCIGIHEIIAEFITDHIPHDYYRIITNITLKVVDDPILDKYFCTEVAANIGQCFLSKVDSLQIPYLIRLLTIHAKYLQALLVDELKTLTKQNFLLMQNNKLIQNIQNVNLSAVQIHRTIKEDCERIHSWFTDGKYNLAIMWAKHIFQSKLNNYLKEIFTICRILNESCKSKVDHETVDYFIALFEQHFETCKSLQSKFLLNIIGYKHVQYLVNAAASDDDVRHYLKCSLLH